MINKMDLSMVIVSWNCKAELLDCLESVVHRICSKVPEIIIVDNASSDGTVEAVRLCFPAVRVLEAGTNLGFARAANLGWQRARGEYVLFLNPDTLILEGALEQALTYLRSRPAVGVIGIKLLNPDGSMQVSCWNFLSLSTLLLDNLLRVPLMPRLLAGRYLYRFWDHGEIREVDWVFGAFMLFRRRVLEEVGGFDEDYFMYGEDMDLCYRVRQRGYAVVYYPAAAIVHYGNRSGEKKWGEGREAEIVRAELTFLLKHYGRLSWFLFRVLAGGVFLTKTAFFYLRGCKDRRGRWKMEAIRYWQMARVCMGTESP